MYDCSFFYENLKVPTVAMGERQRGLRLTGQHTGLGLRRGLWGHAEDEGLRGDPEGGQRCGIEESCLGCYKLPKIS